MMAKKKPANIETNGTDWQTRIVGHDRVDPNELVANPLNFRTHPMNQRAALSGSIKELGFIRSVTVNKRTGNIVDGHERVWQALHSEQSLIDVEYVDLSEEEEKKALAYMDPISEMATVDAGKLDELLREIETGDEALAAMLAELAKDAGIVPGEEKSAPDDFKAVDENIEVNSQCPKCGFQWQGSSE